MVFPKIPAGLVDRGRERLPTVGIIENRQFLGDLIFSVSSSKRKAVGNNSRQFEIGQVLEFGQGSGGAVEPMLVSQITDIQHNTNTFDYVALGVTADEQATIARHSLRTYDALMNELNLMKRKRADTEIDINTQQKVINETTRTLAALGTIDDASGEIVILIRKLKKKRDDAFVARDLSIKNANDYAAEANVILTKLRAVAIVLK